jgi:predicted dehydrogenase/type 1 glutamine amidotransferase
MHDADTVLVISSPDQLYSLDSLQVVVFTHAAGPLNKEQELALVAFVERGGGLVCSGDTIEAYHDYATIGDLFGEVYGACIPRCELIARVATEDHYITRRADPSFAVVEEMYLLDHVPADAEVLWRLSWRYTSRALAYTRAYGKGRVFCTTLGSAEETSKHPVFAQMLERAIRYVAGAKTEEQPVRVALLGYGVIGLEHATAITSTPGLTLSLVCDRDERRLRRVGEAFPDASTCTDMAQILDDPTIDAVIISTPPNTHAPLAMQMLQAGKHVVTEKPFCLTTAEADAMIELAAEKQRTLTIYQCRRWDADYLAIQRVLQQDLLGPAFHIETFIGSYAHPCDYWHSHEPISGGVFYDWGAHYLDWILNLVPDPVVSVRGVEHKRVWHDVTNADQASVYLRFAGGQEASFIHSDIAAALKPKWYILCERGAIVGQWRYESIKSRRWSGDLIEERLAPSEALPTLTAFIRDSGDSIHEQQLALPPMPQHAFHRNLANHLHQGEALAVPPEAARRNIVVMEAAKRSAERGGETMSVHC